MDRLSDLVSAFAQALNMEYGQSSPRPPTEEATHEVLYVIVSLRERDISRSPTH